jgi:hypothetical protein
VDNNVWLVGDERDVIVVDAAHDAEAIATAVGDRRVLGIVCTGARRESDPDPAASPPLPKSFALLV